MKFGQFISLIAVIGLVGAWPLGARGEEAPAAAATGAAATAAAAGGPAEATVRTTAGLEFRGKIIEENGDQVTILTQSGPVTVPRQVIQSIKYDNVDDRAASVRIPAVDVPAGSGPAYLDRARTAFQNSDHEQTVGLCKGLMNLKTSEFTADQRQQLGKMAAASYFELKDWSASGEGLRYAARAVENEVDRTRLQAMAEALVSSTPPNISGQTAASFDQAQQLAMKWKADQIFQSQKDYIEGTKDLNERAAVDRVSDAARTNLSKAEMFVPGYSMQRYPELLKMMADRMMDAVDKGTAICDEEIKYLMQYRKVRVASLKVAEEYDTKVVYYLKIRQASQDLLANVRHIETKYQAKELYDAKRWDERAQKVEELRYYPKQPGFKDNTLITTSRHGS